jgi:dTDP-4-amino-4,6-dideoxygalactose transaminase
MNVPFVDLKTQYLTLQPDLDREIRSVMEACSFIQGEVVDRFESAFAKYLDVRHAIGVANGTDALYLSLRARGIGSGDEVITAANTFIATAEAVTATGARVVLVDVDPETYTLDTSLVEAAITPNTKAIMPVHLYGQPADLDAIMDIARRFEIDVIEDACQAHGAFYDGRRVGTFGTAACFSFYPGKNLGAYGDAGMVVTNDDALADHLRMLSNHGSKTKYHHDIVGWNSRLDSIQAAVLVTKLPFLDSWNELRRNHARFYKSMLSDVGVKVPKVVNSDHVWHLYVVETENRDELSRKLGEHGIATGIHYPVPLHLTPAYTSLGYERGSFPVTERAAERILSLPMFPELSEEQLEFIGQTLRQVAPSPNRV